MKATPLTFAGLRVPAQSFNKAKEVLIENRGNPRPIKSGYEIENYFDDVYLQPNKDIVITSQGAGGEIYMQELFDKNGIPYKKVNLDTQPDYGHYINKPFASMGYNNDLSTWKKQAEKEGVNVNKPIYIDFQST